jgi:ABC-type multidrug transport system fused ATPase/permease subunit
VAAYTYPLLDVFLSVLWFFLFFLWIWILITVFIDIFRSHDMGGGAKALWFLFVLFIPLIGVLVYLIVRGGKMHERAVAEQRQQDAAFQSYVREVASDDSASEIEKLADLRDKGVISEQEFQQAKAKALG